MSGHRGKVRPREVLVSWLCVARFECDVNCVLDTMASVLSPRLTVKQPPEAQRGTSFNCVKVKALQSWEPGGSCLLHLSQVS